MHHQEVPEASQITTHKLSHTTYKFYVACEDCKEILKSEVESQNKNQMVVLVGKCECKRNTQ